MANETLAELDSRMVTFTRKVLEKITIRCRFTGVQNMRLTLDRFSSDLNSLAEHYAEKGVAVLEAHVLGDLVKEDDIILTVKTPANWWEHFKERFLSKWLTVNYVTKEAKYSVKAFLLQLNYEKQFDPDETPVYVDIMEKD